MMAPADEDRPDQMGRARVLPRDVSELATIEGEATRHSLVSASEPGLSGGRTPGNAHRNVIVLQPVGARVQLASKSIMADSNLQDPAPPREIVPKDANTWSTATSDGSQIAQTETQPSSSSSSTPSPSRNRHRGYSLRRSIFTQNMQKQSGGDDMIMEMNTPGLAKPKIQASHKSGKRQTSIIIETPVEDDEEFPVNPVRLSDPVFDKPLYQKWLSNQRGPPSFPDFLRKRYRYLRKKLSWTQETPFSKDGRHVVVNAVHGAQNLDERTGRAYISNTIRSCRYTLLNFVPRQLVAQFSKLANFYFLCVSILQMIPGLSTTGSYTTILPLLFFVGISMAKEGYDDVRRYRLDKEENERDSLILLANLPIQPSGKYSEPSAVVSEPHYAWKSEKGQNVRVGDVVLLKRDSPAPADLILLRSEDKSGTAYIETKSLDGETNLKSRQALSELSELCQSEDAVRKLGAEFVAEDPNLDLYKFEGRVIIDGKVLPLTNSEIIYRGSILRNTASVYGIVIYSGEECKIRMNANKNPRTKAPTLQALVNKVVIIIAGIVLSLGIFMTVAYQFWRRSTENRSWYLHEAGVGFGPILTSFIIMFNTMLPLSLYVSLEIVKVSQMALMNDIDMYDPESDTPMEARTSTINEELGQVNYIFSDKTGTLTNNSMKFRKMSVAGTAWLHDQDLQEEAAQLGDKEKLLHKKRNIKGKGVSIKKPRGTFNIVALRKSAASASFAAGRPDLGRMSLARGHWQPPTKKSNSLHCGKTEEMLDYIYRRPATLFAQKARFFILSLALCHTCVPEKDEEGTINFQATSPDELALVMAAQDLGYIVVERQSSTLTVKTYPRGEDQDPHYETFEILNVIEFSSLRKRMSIIVRFPDHRICIICKGADTTIRGLLHLADLASAQVGAIQHRAGQRKSLEVKEALRRKSVQTNRNNSPSRLSLGGSVSMAIPRNSSLSSGPCQTPRDSIDHWLRERENDIELSTVKDSSQFYSSHRSSQLRSPPTTTQAGGRRSLNNFESPRSSFQADEAKDLVDEMLVTNDVAVFERCFQHIEDFATEGLRTLLYGYRYMSETEYDGWNEKYLSATTSLVDRQKKVEEAGELIETQLELLGATAIEDKLQKGVPDAIDRFRRAGIKLWMLTGDKRETAINIGYASRLIKSYSTCVILDHEHGELPARIASAVASINNKRTAHSVLIVDGGTLALIESDSTASAAFTHLAILADSVICCRASPGQKATLVKTIRTKVKGSVTLAIGDGANDIAMIQEAHVGIGIAGKEGLQAARSSDYSIAQFRFLLKLLLVHGRWNYIRICKYTLGTFWKEMMFYLVQALYQRWNGYTGTSLYEPWSLSMFNTLFTSLPVIFVGIFEKDLMAPTLLAVPELYSIGQHNRGFNIKLYFWWAFMGTCEAVIVFFTIFSIYGEAMFTKDNQLYAMGVMAFTACVTTVSIKIQVLELHNKSVTAAIAIFLSLSGWWTWNMLFSVIYAQNAIYDVNHGLLDRFGRNPLWWVTLILVVVSVCLFEISVRSIQRAFLPRDVDIFQEYEQDREVRKRLEEAAADLLQQGWDRGTKKSSIELVREEANQAEREAQIQELLDRPRTMEDREPSSGIRRRHSSHTEDPEVATPVSKAEENMPPGSRSLDHGELFSKGFGSVRKGQNLR